VILTPQVSAHSDLGDEARFAIGVENLRRYVAGRGCCRWWTWRGAIGPDSAPVALAAAGHVGSIGEFGWGSW